MNGRRIRARRGDDETVGLAGWLYTDLMLGLAVVFLGAIAFTAATKPEESATPTTTTSTTVPVTTTSTIPPTTTLPQPCTLQREPSDRANRVQLPANASDADLAAAFQSKVGTLLADRGLPEGTRIGFALIFGGGASSNAGVASAGRVEEQLRRLFPAQFQDAAVRDLWDQSLRGTVNADVFFLVGDC